MKFKLKVIKDCIRYWGWKIFTIRPLMLMLQTLDEYQEYFLEGNCKVDMIIAPDNDIKLPKYKLHYTRGTGMHSPRFYFDEYPAIHKCYDLEEILYKKLTVDYHIEEYIESIEQL